MGGLLCGLVIGLAFLKYENHPKIRWTIRLTLLGVGLALLSKESSNFSGLIASLIFFPLAFGFIGIVIDLIKNKNSENKNSPSFDTTQYKQEAGSSEIKAEINLSKNETIAHQNDSKIKFASDEDRWAKALEEFESKSRIQGLYAKLYTQHDGNEQRIKSAYLKVRFEQLKREQQELLVKETAQAKVQSELLKILNNSLENEVGRKITLNKVVDGIECFYFDDGQVAIKVTENRFRLYVNFETAETSIKYANNDAKDYAYSEMRYLNYGFIDWIDLKNDKKIISCPRCNKKTRVPSNKELEIICPSCKFQWREKT